MSDGGKSGLAQIGSDLQEAVVKPISDEVGKALESATSSITGNFPTQNLDPKVQSEKKAAEGQRKIQATAVINSWKERLQADLQKVRSDNLQKEKSRLETKSQEEKVKQYKVSEKKKQVNVALMAKNTTESKKGVGG